MVRISQNMMLYVAVILIQCTNAGMILISKAALSSGMKPSVFVAYRQALATLALLPIFISFQSKGSTPLTWKSLGKIFLVASLGLATSMILMYTGLHYISATFGTAIMSTSPGFVFVVAVCLRVERLDLTQRHGMAKVFGAMLCISGAMAFTFYKGPALYAAGSQHQATEKTQTKEEWIKGSFLSLTSLIIYSIWFTMQAPLLDQCPGTLRLTVLQSGFSFLTAAMYGAATERHIASWKLGWNVGLLSIAYCGIVVTGITYWLQAWVIEKKGPVFPAVFGPLALVFATILAAILLKETLHWGSILGSVLLVAGLYAFLWGKNREVRQSLQESDPSKEQTHLESIVTSNDDQQQRKIKSDDLCIRN